MASVTIGYARKLTNRDRLLRFVIENPGVNRSDLIESSGMSRSTVALVVGDLIAQGVVEEKAPGVGGPGAGGGRPALSLFPVMPHGLAVALDFGHNHVAVAVADLSGSSLGELREPLDVDGHATEALDVSSRLLERIMNERELHVADVHSVVASIPGPVDSDTGLVRSPTILSSWVGIDPAQELERRIGVPVEVVNDANLGAWGEYAYGVAQSFTSVVYIKASDGIGAGIIIKGEMLCGTRGLSGEIGHTPTGDDARRVCRCGNTGCLEVVASSAAVREKLAITHPSLTADQPLSMLSDPVSDRVFSEAGRALGKVVANVCNLLNPSAVIIGGELGAVGEPFVEGVRESVDRIAQPATAASVKILPASLGNRAELMGALSKAIEYGGVSAVFG